MKLFVCASCQQVVHFENSQCTRCGHALAYLPERGVLAAIEPVADDSAGSSARSRRRRGRALSALRQSDRPRGVQLGRVRGRRSPVLSRLPTERGDSKPRRRPGQGSVAEGGREQAPDDLHVAAAGSSRRTARRRARRGSAFAFKQDMPGEDKVLIGHERRAHHDQRRGGRLAVSREDARWSWARAYRTLLGHFRHEIGHYYWDRLIKNAAPPLAAFRDRFGDERASYEDAVAAHYRDGAPPDWPARYVSSYASMHAWEDWAESWAHYLHMVDTLETARSFGLSLWPRESAAELRGRHASTALRRLRGSRGRVGSVDRRAQCLEPQHGTARSVSVRALRAGAGEDQVRSRRDRAAPGGLRPGRCRAPRASSLMNASRSALIVSACVVIMPCG